MQGRTSGGKLRAARPQREDCMQVTSQRAPFSPDPRPVRAVLHAGWVLAVNLVVGWGSASAAGPDPASAGYPCYRLIELGMPAGANSTSFGPSRQLNHRG